MVRPTPMFRTHTHAHCYKRTEDVDGADAGGEQRLVRVARSCVRDEHALLVAHPIGHCVWSVFVKYLLGCG